MVDENPVKFKSIDLMWLFSMDLVNPIYDMDSVIKKIEDCKYFEAYLKHYTAEEKVKGNCEIKTKVNLEKSRKKHLFDLLTLFEKVDSYNLDLEYLENQSFSRFLLKNLKFKFTSIGDQSFDSDVLLTVSDLGIAVLTFWVHIKTNLDSIQIAKLQLLPIEEQERILVEVPIELLEEMSEIDNDYLQFYLEKKNEGKKSISLQITFKGLILLYWITLINIINDRKYKSHLLEDNKFLIEKKYRYEVKCIFPFVAVFSTEQEFKYADDLVLRCPKQIYQILSHIYDYDYKLVNSEILDDFLKPNITERRDFAYLNALGSVLLIFGSETSRIIENQLKNNKNYISIDLGLKKLILDAFIIIEILQIQRFYLGFLNKLLARRITEMNTKEISMMRSYLLGPLDIYYSKVTGNSLASKRLEHGRNIMEIEENYKLINQKKKLLGAAMDNFKKLKTSFFEFSIIVILGFIPVTLVLIPNPIFGLIFAIIILLTGISITHYFSKLYWYHLRGKEIKILFLKRKKNL